MRKTKHQYEIIIFWDRNDKIYVAEVPELPGCMAHGNSYADAICKAEEAISLWIETAKIYGEKIPEPRGERLIFA